MRTIALQVADDVAKMSNIGILMLAIERFETSTLTWETQAAIHPELAGKRDEIVAINDAVIARLSRLVSAFDLRDSFERATEIPTK